MFGIINLGMNFVMKSYILIVGCHFFFFSLKKKIC